MREICLEHHDTIIKNDNEPALVAIVNEVSKLRAAAGGGKFMPENSPTGDSKPNGIVERAIQSVEGTIRIRRRWNPGGRGNCLLNTRSFHG